MALLLGRNSYPSVRLPLPELDDVPVPPADGDGDLASDVPVPPAESPHLGNVDMSPPLERSALRFPLEITVTLPPRWCEEKPEQVVLSHTVADHFEQINSRHGDGIRLLQSEKVEVPVAPNEVSVLFVGGESVISPFCDVTNVVFSNRSNGVEATGNAPVQTPPGENHP
jgi:hypothetical protein